MPFASFVFSFRVRLPASADRAYRWATDYRPDDPGLMGQKGRRAITRIARDTLLLTDTVREGGRTVRRTRLVRLLPRRRMWTNTHLSGSRRHSQFLYELVPLGPRACRLEFTGLQVERSARTLRPHELARRAREVARDDRATWGLLARALRADLA